MSIFTSGVRPTLSLDLEGLEPEQLQQVQTLQKRLNSEGLGQAFTQAVDLLLSGTSLEEVVANARALFAQDMPSGHLPTLLPSHSGFGSLTPTIGSTQEIPSVSHLGPDPLLDLSLLTSTSRLVPSKMPELERLVGSDAPSPNQVAQALQHALESCEGSERVTLPNLHEMSVAQARVLIDQMAYSWVIANGTKGDVLTSDDGKDVCRLVGASLARQRDVGLVKAIVQELRDLAPRAAPIAEESWVGIMNDQVQSQGEPQTRSLGSFKLASPVDQSGRFLQDKGHDGIALIRVQTHARNGDAMPNLQGEMERLDTLRSKGVPVLETYGAGGSCRDAVKPGSDNNDPVVFMEWIPTGIQLEAKTENPKVVEALTLAILAGPAGKRILDEVLGGRDLNAEGTISFGFHLKALDALKGHLMKTLKQGGGEAEAIKARARALMTDTQAILPQAPLIGDLQLLARGSYEGRDRHILYVIDPLAYDEGTPQEQPLRKNGVALLRSIYAIASSVVGGESISTDTKVSTGRKPTRRETGRVQPSSSTQTGKPPKFDPNDPKNKFFT